MWERCLTPLAQKRFEPQNRHSSAKIAAQSFAVIAQRAKANGRKGYFLALMPARALRSKFRMSSVTEQFRSQAADTAAFAPRRALNLPLHSPISCGNICGVVGGIAVLRSMVAAAYAMLLAASYVSPVTYSTYTCLELGREAQAVAARAATLSGAQRIAGPTISCLMRLSGGEAARVIQNPVTKQTSQCSSRANVIQWSVK